MYIVHIVEHIESFAFSCATSSCLATKGFLPSFHLTAAMSIAGQIKFRCLLPCSAAPLLDRGGRPESHELSNTGPRALLQNNFSRQLARYKHATKLVLGMRTHIFIPGPASIPKRLRVQTMTVRARATSARPCLRTYRTRHNVCPTPQNSDTSVFGGPKHPLKGYREFQSATGRVRGYVVGSSIQLSVSLG
ncbi:hypothetical protein H4582DRAFT_1089482 [Lactarius indigo]|nr:hypothetical protein H4582DRAFT_1089482 [Lactarius indigo]